MSDFIQFRDAVNEKFKSIATNEVFIANVEKDALWDAYLDSFPAGTNPLFRERTTHDCSCCKNFVRHLGKVVGITSSLEVETVWDINIGGVYQEVADKMAQMVREAHITGIYRTTEKRYGLINNTEMMEDGTIHQWEHFHADLPKKLVMRDGSTTVGEAIGKFESSYGVLKRSVTEISNSAIDTVIDLIMQNSLYRGKEHIKTVRKLREIKAEYDSIDDSRKKELFLWTTVAEHGESVRFKNTVIGTLLIDISDEVELEKAVAAFEKKVAPENYKRTTALITQSMIDKANEKIKALGLEDSLYRRFAIESDLTINNVLFADRDSKLHANANPLDELKPSKAKTPSLDKVQEIGIEDFVTNVLPNISTMELLVGNKHTPNFVSLIAPVHDDAKNILKWDNNFSWSYAGEVTDSIKERVKGAGGSVTGEVRASLSWFNYDDLDIHLIEPNGYEIYFGNRNRKSTNGGMLDVDMNAGGRNSREPVENITYDKKRTMKKGIYEIFVVNFAKRESVDVGFTVQIEVDGDVQDLHYKKAVPNSGRVKVATLEVDEHGNVKVVPNKTMESSTHSKEVWNIHTEQFTKVNMMMASPNHWDDNEVGQKHYFFMLEDCKNPDDARGLFNEFLRGDLTEHRKVFEVLGSKLKATHSNDQLSGVGFSTTKPNSIIAKVSGTFNRTLKINF